MTDLSKVNVIFATPALNYSVCTEYLRSVTETMWAFTEAGITNYGFTQRNGDCFISKARNKLVTEFLQDFPTATDLFFIDDDIGWPAAKVVEFLKRDEDIVSGIYPKRSDDIDFPVSVSFDENSGTLIERDGLIKAQMVPGGFLRIKRHVLQALADKSRKFRDLEKDGKTREYYGIFEDGISSDGWYWGEDYTFCRKCLDEGFELWIDPDINFSHRGDKKWTNNLKDHLQVFRDKAAASRKIAA